MKQVYPTIFTKIDTGYLVEVPDLEILTEGCDLSNAIEMARDAIGITAISMENHNEQIPLPSALSDIELAKGTFAKDGDSFISMVDIDFLEYRRKNDNRAVRRNVTLPNWLNREAEKAHINVSKVLQEALMSVLGVNQ